MNKAQGRRQQKQVKKPAKNQKRGRPAAASDLQALFQDGLQAHQAGRLADTDGEIIVGDGRRRILLCARAITKNRSGTEAGSKEKRSSYIRNKAWATPFISSAI